MTRHAMVVRADARAMGAVTDHSTRVAPRWKGSTAKQREIAFAGGAGPGDCVSYKLDADGNKVEGRIFRATRKTSQRRIASQRNEHKARTLELLSMAGNNSDVD